jgi:hypothetical protein
LNSKVILQEERKCIQNELRLELFVDKVVFKIVMLKHFTTKYLNGFRRSHKNKAHHQIEMLEIDITTWPTL